MTVANCTHRQATTAAEIERQLRLLRCPGQVTELRALHVSTPSYRRDHIESGFFDYDHLHDFALAAADLSGKAKGIYFTLNPVAPDLISRRCNRVAVAERGELTSDANIVRREWLLVDADPVRVSGVSATDAEKALALATVRKVRDFLREEINWPAPILSDSGNGYHLLYRIDLPADDGGLVQRCLKALGKQFDTERVTIDQAVFNPARICKLPGTMSCKGDSTPDRPHRLAQIVEGEALFVASKEKLEALAATLEEPKPQAKNNGDYPRSRLLVEKWLGDRGIEFTVASTKASGNRTKYILAHCPFNAEHVAPDACVMQRDDGQLSAKCLHNSCAGRDWQAFKAAIGPPDGWHYNPPLTSQRTIPAPSANGLAESDGITDKVPHEPQQQCNLFTDVGNGRRLVERHGIDFRYVTKWKNWVHFEQTRWCVDESLAIQAAAKETIDAFLYKAQTEAKKLRKELEQYAADEQPPELKTLLSRREAEIKWGTTSQFYNRQGAMVSMARSEPSMPVLPETFNDDLWLLNCPNGTLDLRTGTLRAHDRADYIMKIIPVAFDPSAMCPMFMKFLYRIMNNNTNLIDFLCRAVGYSLTGKTIEQCLFFLHGAGCNGKSTFLGIILHILGDYGMQAVSEMLTLRANETHPTERADLFGKRFVATIETEDGKRMAEALVKQVTGGDRIRARWMKQDFFEWDPTHNIWLAANHRPQIAGTDYGIWRRIKLVPFNVTITEEEKDKDLLDKLKAEAAGILAWAVRGCLEWQKIGLAEPDEVKAAVAEYRAEQDVIGAFLGECCVVGSPDYRVRASDLYQSFQKWCTRSGEKECTQKRFGTELKNREYQTFTSNGTWYRNIMIRVNQGDESEGTEP